MNRSCRLIASATALSALNGTFGRRVSIRLVVASFRPYNTDSWRKKLPIKDTDEPVAPRPAEATVVKNKSRKQALVGTKTGHKSHTYANGAVYLGNWLNFLRHGIGRYEFPNGDVYQGEWVKDKPHGMGRFDHHNGGEYYGNWCEGRREGTGKRVFADGGQYEGEWRHDQIEGHGVFVSADGSKYEGQWLRGRRHGQGKLTLADGSVEEGMWDNGVRQGATVSSDVSHS